MAKIKQWRLKSGADKRFKQGHPWVYSNELTESPKGIAPGEEIELCDAGGKFLARGYGNPASLIAFRAVTRKPEHDAPLSVPALQESLGRALELRKAAGLATVSYRLCFGEADSLPGLVIDRYRLEKGQVYVLQAHTAGADRILGAVQEALASLKTDTPWDKTAVVIRNDLGVRKLEGLDEETPCIAKECATLGDLKRARILIQSASGGSPLIFEADLLGGQKTGFFLDQAGNIALAVSRFKAVRSAKHPKKIQIIDLCCYIGQWSAQLARLFRDEGLEVEVTLVDASSAALDLARRNVESQGAKCETIKGDVLRDLEKLDSASFDLVVCDPPALIKGRKDIPQGTHAYLQLNTQAFRLIRSTGAMITCSCSGLLDEETFIKTVSKAAHRNAKRTRWIGRGAPAADHPMLLEFPEGRYLKCWVGLVDD